MKILKAIGAAVLAVATCFSARAEETLVKEPLILNGIEAGYTVSGLPNNEVAVVFTNHVDGAMNWLPPTYLTDVRFLVVGGGGGGGTLGGAGGGGGGVVTGFVKSVAKKVPVSVVVGDGGGGAYATGSSGVSYSKTTPTHDSSFSINDILYIQANRGGGATSGNGGAGGSGAGGKSGSKNGGAANPGIIGVNASNLVHSVELLGKKGGNGAQSTAAGGGGGATQAGQKAPSNTKAGYGGAGLSSDITGIELVYGSGGGGSTYNNSHSGGAAGSGAGGGGTSASVKNAKPNQGGGGGGHGGNYSRTTGGSGGSGIVVFRYSIPENVAVIPDIASKAYNGTLQIADVEDCDGYTVTENDGGTDGGEYDVVLTLADGYSWDEEGAANPLTLKFAITQVENAWTAAPSITVPEWFKGAAEIGSITPATTQFGNVTVTITKDGQPFEGDYTNLSTFEAGSYVVTFTAPAECSSYTAITEEPTRTVEFIVYAADEVPGYTLTIGEMTVNADRSVSFPYSLDCEVATEYVADVYAAYAIEGSDTTNTYALATGVALTSSGTGSIPDLKPGVNYSVSFYAMVEDEQSEPTTPVIIAIPGAASDLAASATFTNDPMKFIVSGSVVPGIGTTTVTVNWAINDTETLNNTTNFVFQYGDEGTFNFEIPYTSFDDKLTYNVTVQNTVDASTYDEDFTWSSALDATTKSRADAADITYTWTGNGNDGFWTNINNWASTRSPCFGYPDSKYAIANFTSTPGVEIDLNGETVVLCSDNTSDISEGFVFSENLGEVKFKNGTISFSPSGGNFGFGSKGTTVVLDTVKITGVKFMPCQNSTVVFTGSYNLGFTFYPWEHLTGAKLIFSDGEMSCSFGGSYLKYSYSIYIDNAVWNLTSEVGKNGLAKKIYFSDGEGEGARQAQLVVNGSMWLRNTYDINIPAGGHNDASIVLTTKYSQPESGCTFELDVSDYKSGKPVPLVRYTSSTDQALSTDNITLVAYTNGVDGAVDVTADRNATLVWSSEDNTLYYEQDGEGVAMIGEEIYETLQDAVDAAVDGNTITLIDDVDLTTHVVVGKTVTLDLNGYTIGNTVAMWDHLVVAENRGDCNIVSMIRVVGGTLTITDSSDAKTGTVSALENDCFCIHADGGDLVINDGTFVGNVTCIQVDSESIATINGGEFKILQLDTDIPYGYLLNCIDNSGSSIIVNGGTFYGFDPANNSAEGANTDFCAAAAYSYLAETVDGVSVYVVAPAVAKIGNVKYPTLEAALAAASDGNTITLLANVELTDDVTVNKSVTLAVGACTLTIPSGKTITVAEGKSLAVTCGTGGLVVDGTIAVNGTLDVSALSYGASGLIANKAGNLAIGESGSVKLMSVWDSFSPNWLATNSSTFFKDSVAGAQLVQRSGTYTFNGTTWLVANAVAVTQVTANGKTYQEGFATLAAAIAASVDGSVKLIADATEENVVTVSEGVTLDLNGKSLQVLAVFGDLAMNGGSLKTWDATTQTYYFMAAPAETAGALFWTSDAVLNVSSENYGLVLKSGAITMPNTWRSLVGQSLAISAGASFTIPENVTWNLRGNATVDNDATLVCNGTISLGESIDTIDTTATLTTTNDTLNVVSACEGYEVQYANGAYTLVAVQVAGKWDEVIDATDGSVSDVTDANKEAVESALDALAAALGATEESAYVEAVTGYFSRAYGTAKVPATALTDGADNFAVSAAYDLPLMATLPAVTVTKAADGGALAFEFELQKVAIATTAAKAVELVKYSATVNGTYAYDGVKMTVTVVDGKLKAVFNGTDAQGFAKVDFTVPNPDTN